MSKWEDDVKRRVDSNSRNDLLQHSCKCFLKEVVKSKYTYNFYWLGLPIIQIPQDLQALQEIIWEVKPDLIIETGVAHGGSAVFAASMLAILEACGEIEWGNVIGIEINLYPENREAITKHPLGNKIILIDGSSIDEEVIKKVRKLAEDKRVLVCLDSNHTHEHVLAELRAYAPLVSVGSYIVIDDTGVEDLSEDALFDRPWGKGNSPKSAIWEYLRENDDFVIDNTIDSKLVLSSAPDGYLRRIK